MEGLFNQHTFLFSNERDKSQFITLLNHYLQASNQIVHQSAGDTDTETVANSLQYALGTEVTVVVEDTDILVLLMYHWQKEMQIIIVYQKNKSHKKLGKVRDLIANCGEVVVHHIFFIHAWSGCDTTSATYN